jgi:L-serine dehydratase
MRAALRFASQFAPAMMICSPDLMQPPARVLVELYGSLALTGIGHGTDRAILLGLSGEAPDTVDPAAIDALVERVRTASVLDLLGKITLPFNTGTDLLFHRDRMYPPQADAATSHPNGMRFTAFTRDGDILAQQVFYSVGGGFILSAAELAPDPQEKAVAPRKVPYPFSSAEELLAVAEANQLTIAELILANEVALLSDPRINRPTATPQSASPEARIESSILAIWQTMQSCTERGIATEGILPGGLSVRRRAPRLYQRIQALDESGKPRDPLAPLDWVSLFAIAVNEENAAGGRVVTAPTNGAAGVIPAIAHYYMRFIETDTSAEEKQAGLLRYFLTAAAIGILYKENASISGAEVGCQGEVGVACSMAAGGLVAALNGTNEQIEHAAEIAMEHNLGMTCDPIGGLVQIPCIERNAMGAVKAINAASLALSGDGSHRVSLDEAIATMRQTGLDMRSEYKETAQGGLAVHVTEC